MPRYIAIEWDSREARIAVANSRGNDVLVEDAFSVPLAPREEGKTGDPQIGEKINAALDQRGVKRAEALVAIGRAAVELKQLSFPPVPDEELPEMVRWQATREFHSLGEDWPLDYMPLTSASGEQRVVLAAAINPELLAQFHQGCQLAGVKPKRLVLRPSAAASLFLRRADANEHQVRLIVDLLSEEVDLTVLVERDVVFLRTARLPTEGYTPAERTRQLLAEIRRTMAAAHNQLGARRVQAIYVAGSQAENAELVARMEQELTLPVRLFEPFAEVQLERSLRNNLPANAGRYSALLGMLCDEITGAAHGLDFLNPRRPPAPPSRRKQYIIAGVATAAAVLLATFVIRWQLGNMDDEIAQLEAKSKSMDPVVKEAEALEKQAAEIRKWTVSDIAWLDEMRELAQELPASKDVVLTGLRFSAHPEGGMITMDVRGRESSVIAAMEKNLRDKHHVVEGRGRSQDGQNRKYSWSWKTSVQVAPQTKDDYLQRKPAAPETAKVAEKPKE
jgi:Tfp pilus assembly PilM family ATPase/Tfp pilus assembly protein PilN